MKITEFYNKRYSTDHTLLNSHCLNLWQKFTYDDIVTEHLQQLNILEIGVGPNGLVYTLKREYPGNRYFGLDLDENSIKNLNSIGISTLNQDISADTIGFESDMFDIIIFNEVIEHLFDCQHALNEIYRLLKKGGKLYISTHNTFNIFMRLRFLFGLMPAPSLDVSSDTMGEHIRIFSYDVLYALLIRAGFKEDRLVNRSWFKLHFFQFYTHYLTRLLARHLYLICQK